MYFGVKKNSKPQATPCGYYNRKPHNVKGPQGNNEPEVKPTLTPTQGNAKEDDFMQS